MSLFYRTVDHRVLELDPGYVASLAPSKRETLLAYSVDPKPTPASTQLVIEGPIVLTATTARRTWQVVEKTAEQLAADAFRATQGATLEQARLVYGALKAGTGTAAERLARVERVCAYYLRELFGSEPQ